MNKRRVVVTGLGAVSPVGAHTEEMWSNLLEGKSGISTLERFDTPEFDVKIGGKADDFDAEDYLEPRAIKRLDRFVLFGVGAATQAIEDAGLDPDEVDPTRVGSVLGSGIGGLETIENQHETMFDRGPRRVSPFFIPKMMMNAAPAQISMEFGFEGPNYAVASACSSGNHAIGDAMELIQAGKADAMVTGGVEAALTMSAIGGFSSLKALSTRNDDPERASRPFEKNRDGFVMGEGAGVLLLEELERAKERGAEIYAEILGFGATSDAHHITAPAPEGKGGARAMELALTDAEVSTDRISYINAHGTSTELNDKMETMAIRHVTGEHADAIPVSSTKSMIGHSLGAAAGIEAVVSALTLRDGKIHPTINYEEPDPDCDLDYVGEGAREIELDVILSNSFGFGGHNSCLAIGKFRE